MSRDIRNFLVRKHESSIVQNGAPTPKRARIAASTSSAENQTITIDDDEEKASEAPPIAPHPRVRCFFRLFCFMLPPVCFQIHLLRAQLEHIQRLEQKRAEKLILTQQKRLCALEERENALGDRLARPRLSLGQMIGERSQHIERKLLVETPIHVLNTYFLAGGKVQSANLKAQVDALIKNDVYRRLVYLNLLFDCWKVNNFNLQRGGRELRPNWTQVLKLLFDLTEIDFDAIEAGAGFAWIGMISDNKRPKIKILFTCVYGQSIFYLIFFVDTALLWLWFWRKFYLAPPRSSARTRLIAATSPAACAPRISGRSRTRSISCAQSVRTFASISRAVCRTKICEF